MRSEEEVQPEGTASAQAEVGASLVSSGQPMRSRWLGRSAYCKARWLEVGPERWHEVSVGPSRIL